MYTNGFEQTKIFKTNEIEGFHYEKSNFVSYKLILRWQQLNFA